MTTTPRHSISALYPAVLGDAWHELDHAVQRLHAPRSPLHARGTFAVRAGTGALIWCLLKIARMPAATEAVDMQLVVTRLEPRTKEAKVYGETWQRTFASHVLVSTQREGGPGLLLERMGLLDLFLRLTAAAGALEYQSQRVAVRLFGLRIPLPRWLAPTVTAREKSGYANPAVCT